jgi:putative ABC transport system permease protein
LVAGGVFYVMKALTQDLRYGARILAKNPGFTIIALAALALGIGANTVIFSIVNGMLLRPLPYKDADRLMVVEEKHDQATSAVTYATFLDLASRSQSFDQIGAYRDWTFNIAGEGDPEQVEGALVSEGLLRALAAQPILGRVFLPEDDRPGATGAVILGYGLWQRRFASDPSIVGKTLKINGASFTVAGVMPPGFQFPGKAELWTALVAVGPLAQNRRSHLLKVVGRLKHNVTPEQAQAELSAMTSVIDEQNPGVDPGLELSSVGLQKKLVARVRPALIVLLSAVGFILLIACANVANLQLARAAARQKEIAIRTALGAGRARIVRQLLTESLILAFAGGAAGLTMAEFGLKLIVALAPRDVPRLAEAGIDGTVLAFTLLGSITSGVLFGLAPALRASSSDLQSVLKEGGRGSAGSGGQRLRSALVVCEVAMSLMLLIGSGLLINSFLRLLRVNVGFEPANLLTMQLFLSPSKYAESQPKTALAIQSILERVNALPGVGSAGVVNTLPITGGPSTDFTIERRPDLTQSEPDADIRIADANYFRAMGIPLLRGRWFTDEDRPGAPRVMVINQTMARRYWPDADPIGQRVTMLDWGDPMTGQVIGVVGDVKANGLETQTGPMIYWHYSQFPSLFNRLVVRPATASFQHSVTPRMADLVSAIKSEVSAVDRDQPISSVMTMEQVLADSYAPRRFYLVLMGIFASLALALAIVGIYGVMSYMVTQRTHEVGVRMALGAHSRDVVGLFLRQGTLLTLTGIAIGVAGSLAALRMISSLLFGVTSSDPATFAVVSLFLGVVALLACFVPARRATKVDPMSALRYE